MKKFFLATLGFFLAAVIFFTFKTLQFYQKIYTPKKEIPKEKTQYNILLFGYGGGKHEGAYLTDTIMLFHLDLASKSATLISIPRDLWVKLPTKDNSDFHTKINAVYQMELFPENYPLLDKRFLGDKKDANLIKYIVGGIFGVKIDNYIAVDFEGFKKAIDLLGGVEVNVEKSFTDPQYPIEGKEKDLCDQQTEELFKKAEVFLKPGYNPEDRDRVFSEDPKVEEFVKNATASPHLAFPCRYETITFTKGKTLMNGETALKYVRSRHSNQDGNDFSRARRQHLLLMAVKDKVLSLGFIAKAPLLLNQLGEHIKTDLSISDIKKLSQESLKANQYYLTTFVISTDNFLKEGYSSEGGYILYPKEGIDQWEHFQKEFKLILKGATPTPPSPQKSQPSPSP
ncbi:MAG: LCP family protein [Microgenomates group bacterium]